MNDCPRVCWWGAHPSFAGLRILLIQYGIAGLIVKTFTYQNALVIGIRCLPSFLRNYVKISLPRLRNIENK
jgi:hypothetical protein